MLALMSLPPTPYLMASSPLHTAHKRPRGLWKGRRDATPNLGTITHASCSSPFSERPPLSRSASICDYDDDEDRYSSSSGGSKRRRCTGYFDLLFDSDQPSPFTSCASGTPTPLSDYYCNNAHVRPPPKIITTEPIASMNVLSSPKGKQPSTADYEDWENLKELFARAVDRYDADDLPQALPLLRAVIRECHRFLTVHPDPSVVYADTHTLYNSRSPEAMTPTEERLSRDWGHDLDVAMTSTESHRLPSPELPTAFHAIFGITLFFMGTLIAQDKSLALADEPDEPSSYWLAALDVFETGENLPSRVGGMSHRGSSFNDLAEDWRMAIIWGRTLVCLADEKVSYSIQLAKQGAPPEGEYCYLPNSSPFSMSEPAWSPDSPFAAIALARPPVSRRMSLYSASVHDVMVLAMDQFSRGILHMPHPHYSQSHNPTYIYQPVSPTLRSRSQGRSYSPARSRRLSSPGEQPLDALSSFSRPRELFTIASEVLGVAERLPDGSQRAYWAGWADSVFTQMKMEADMEAWRGPLTAARGRCWLVVGSAPVEELEAALERGDDTVLASREAEEAREGLTMAVSFFERAKGAVCPPAEDVTPLLAEALFTLANLTADENKREELYSRAQAEARDLDLDLDSPDDLMDES